MHACTCGMRGQHHEDEPVDLWFEHWRTGPGTDAEARKGLSIRVDLFLLD